MSLDDIAKFASIAQSVMTTAGILVGGIWTYLLFVRKRQNKPHAVMEHLVSSRPLDDSRMILSVDVVVRNTGEVLLAFDSSTSRKQKFATVVKQMAPEPPGLGEWLDPPGAVVGSQNTGWETVARGEWLGRIAIEPGEYDDFHYDFVLPRSIRAVQVTSEFPNLRRRREPTWIRVSAHDVDTARAAQQMGVVADRPGSSGGEVR